MAYKAFEDFYKESEIKHLVLHQHRDYLVSPPFCTDNCKDYNKFLFFKDGNFSFLDLDLPPATSKFNGICSIGDSIWTIPYGIFDSFQTVLQIKNGHPIYHHINKPGKGQFYSLSYGDGQGFSFPLGYEETTFAIHIRDDSVNLIDFKTNGHKKMHMGTVYCNGKFWSPPRGDTEGYQDIVSFDGNLIERYPITFEQSHILRKYTDFVVKGNKLYSLPFGQNGHLDQILVFDTDTLTYRLDRLNVPIFFKKFNSYVLLGDIIISLPYGHKDRNDNNFGIIYNCETGESKSFDLGNDLNFGGKYRFRSGIEFNNHAVFFPSGTPSIPIIILDRRGKIINKIYLRDFVLGRPIVYENKLCTIAYEIQTKNQYLIFINRDFSTEFVPIL